MKIKNKVNYQIKISKVLFLMSFKNRNCNIFLWEKLMNKTIMIIITLISNNNNNLYLKILIINQILQDKYKEE